MEIFAEIDNRSGLLQKTSRLMFGRLYRSTCITLKLAKKKAKKKKLYYSIKPAIFEIPKLNLQQISKH